MEGAVVIIGGVVVIMEGMVVMVTCINIYMYINIRQSHC